MKTSPVPPAENAPLFLLDGLDGPELEAYKLARRYDPVVQAAECEAAETLADLALSVPQIAPPESCLAAIRSEIQTNSHPLPVRFVHRLLRVSPGWAAAAALAVLAGWSMLKRSEAEKELARLRVNQQQYEKVRTLFAGNMDGTANPDNSDSRVAVAADVPGPLEANSRDNRRTVNARSSSHQLIQDRPALQARLNLLEKRNAQRFQPVPGLNRPVIFEMQNPDESPAGDGHKLTLSSGKVGDILAEALLSGHAGTNKTDDPSAPEKPPFRIGESNRDDEVLIESGMRDLSVFQLPEEVHVRNLGLPVDDAAANGLQPLPDGSGFYEPKSNLIWRPASDGKGYIGRRPPEDFSPPPVAAGPEIPAPQTTSPPATPEPAATRAFPIFDESTGQGSIILQNLPAPEPGKSWQLWFTDPEVSAPFSPGILPPMETGSGRVFFDLGRTGYAPASCFLTQEPASGSTLPTGQVVLKGP